jgi:hypothetical protein
VDTADLRSLGQSIVDTCDALDARDAALTKSAADLAVAQGQVTELEADVTALQADVTALRQQIADLTKPPTIYGVSNSASITDYTTRQAPNLHADALYWYGQATTTWTLNAIPPGVDVWLQSLATTPAAADALIKSLPDTRTGRVFLHHKNEPEDNYPAATYVGLAKLLYDALDRARAAGRPLAYVVKAAELNGYQLVKGIDNSAYIPAGCQHVGISVYGGVKNDSAGHATWAIPAAQWASLISAFVAKVGLPWSAAAVGLGYTAAQLTDPVARKNRADGMVALAAALKTAGSEHFMWYDRVMPDGTDYTFAHDPDLTTAWLTLT